MAFKRSSVRSRPSPPKSLELEIIQGFFHTFFMKLHQITSNYTFTCIRTCIQIWEISATGTVSAAFLFRNPKIICNFFQIFNQNILIISEHFITRMTHQFELIFICPVHSFHERRECMTAGVRRVLMPENSFCNLNKRIIDPRHFDNRIENGFCGYIEFPADSCSSIFIVFF